jgi:hypothetical protein
MPAKIEHTKVEKAHFNRLFDLVREGPGEKDHGDVRLPDFDPERRIVIGPRLTKRLDESFEFHDESPRVINAMARCKRRACRNVRPIRSFCAAPARFAASLFQIRTEFSRRTGSAEADSHARHAISNNHFWARRLL